ncbi:MAG: GGDEF domain-containing protein [Ahrensia sp.]|nr:GGDEF domain-containing protein [Ahrensia sp.]
MTGSSVYQLLQPLTLLLYALGFWVIWFYIRNISAAAYFAAAYLVGGIGYCLDIYSDVLGAPASYLVLGFYCLTTTLMSAGLFVRVGRPMPWRLVAVLLATTVPFFWYFREVLDSIVAQLMLVNLVNAVLVALPLPALRGRQHIPIDRVIFWLLTFIVVQVLLRTFVTLYLDAGTLTQETYEMSITGVAFYFTTSLAAAALSLTLYVALGIDIVHTLKKQSDTDAMTGLLNRAGFEEKAQKVMAWAAIERRPVCMIITDLDHFKRVNDTLGHATGDVVISFYGRILLNMSRSTDVAGRVGGEEFCLLLSDCGVADAEDLAEAVRHSFHTTDIPGTNPPLRCAASFGIAMQRGDEPLAELYKRADAALYAAKEAGRNCVRTIDNYNWRPQLDAPPMQPDLARRVGDRMSA